MYRFAYARTSHGCIHHYWSLWSEQQWYSPCAELILVRKVSLRLCMHGEANMGLEKHTLRYTTWVGPAQHHDAWDLN